MANGNGGSSPLDVWRLRQLVWSERGPAKVAQRALLQVLTDYHAATGEVYPSIGTLAEKTGIAERAVPDHLRRLAETGWLRIETRGGGQGWRRHRYVLLWPRGFDATTDTWLNEVRARRDAAREAHREAAGWTTE